VCVIVLSIFHYAFVLFLCFDVHRGNRFSIRNGFGMNGSYLVSYRVRLRDLHPCDASRPLSVVIYTVSPVAATTKHVSSENVVDRPPEGTVRMAEVMAEWSYRRPAKGDKVSTRLRYL